MSTTVDKDRIPKPRARSSAAETRERVLQSARIAFSRAGFDHVGIREIAGAAATDPAVVIRLFGSKEALFALVAEGAFGLEPAFERPLDGLGEAVARHLMAPLDQPYRPEGFDAFQFLLRSSTSPVAAPILSRSLHESFVTPLARRLGSPQAEARAALVTAYVLGFTTLRFALASPALDAASTEFLIARLGGAIQACLAESAMV